MTEDEISGADPETRRQIEKLALERWPEVVDAIDAVVKRFEHQEHRALPGTSLIGDDRKADPFHTSHVVLNLLNAGIDNLNGIRHLIWGRPGNSDQPVLHQATHYVLARAAIEDFATAFWILHPTSRTVRVERTLLWHAQNAVDQDRAINTLGVEHHPLEDKLRRLEEIAQQSLGRVPRDFRRGYSATRVVKYVDSTNPHANDQEVSTEFLWRLCSGFTHGRFWSSLLFLEQERIATDDPNVVTVRMTSDLTRALWPAKDAMHLLERLLKLYDQRNSRHTP